MNMNQKCDRIRTRIVSGWVWFFVAIAGGSPMAGCETNTVLATVFFQEQDDEPVVTLDPEFQRRVRLFLRQLNADERDQREQAERDMLALGTKLLDYLPPELEGQSAELKERLTRLRLALEKLTAEEVTKPISLNFQGELPLLDLLETVRQQTNNATQVANMEPKQLRVDWENVSYWAAMDEVMDRLQLTFNSDQSRGVTLYPAVDQASRRSIASYHGAFRVSPIRLQHTRDLTSSRPPQVQFALQLEWEPKLRVIRLDLPLDGVEILDPTDPTIIQPVGAVGERVGFGVNSEKSGARANFAWPNLDAWETKIVDVRGKFNLLVAGREETFRFSNLKTALESKQLIEKSGIKVQLEDISYDEHLMLIKIGIQFSDAKQSLESHFGWIYQNSIEIQDREGKSHAYLTIESGGRRDQGLSLVYIFDRFDDLEGFQLIYRSPGILIETEVPFLLKSIPLR